KVDEIVIDNAFFFRTLQYGSVQHSFIHFRKQCQVMDIHSSIPSIGEMRIREFSKSTSFTTSSIYGIMYSLRPLTTHTSFAPVSKISVTCPIFSKVPS